MEISSCRKTTRFGAYMRWKTRNPESYLVCSAKGRARRNRQRFSITAKDIKIPKTCPILGIPLFIGGFRNPNSPSLDRIDNSKGYTKKNVQVISYRANVLKNNGSIKELKALAKWILQRFK
jgi:hypothetical protein